MIPAASKNQYLTYLLFRGLNLLKVPSGNMFAYMPRIMGLSAGTKRVADCLGQRTVIL
jgi:hypothetical protein